MTKAERKLYNQQYYEKNKEHILFYSRERNLLYRNRKRKYYRESRYSSNMPVDLQMMRNRHKFNEGLPLGE